MGSKIVRLYKDDFWRIDEFLKNNYSTPMHWQDWNNIVSKYYKTEFFYFAFINCDKIIGVCPVHRKKNKYVYRLKSGPREYYVPFGGWIFSTIMNFDFSLIKLYKNESFEIFTMPLIKEFNTSYNGCNLLKLFETSLINLEKEETKIWNNLSSQKKYKIRKAVKNNVEILNSEKIDFNEFYDFYCINNKRYGLANISKEFFQELVSNSKNINIDFLLAKKDSEILGSVALVSDKFYSIYWLGTRTEKALNIGYFDLLHWEMIKIAKSKGCRYYDLCYLEKERLPNIYKFKIGFSGETFPVLNIIKKPILYRLINKIQKLTV